MERSSTPPSPSTALPAIPDVDLVEVVGSGGSGVVYRGRQQAFGRDVAVKVVSAHGQPGAVGRWERELSAMGRLSNHPNIVAVYAGGVTETGSPYLVMPYVPGGTLLDRLRSTGPMDPDEVAVVGSKLAGALATAHDAGVLHRDVKPENVLLSPYGEPQLTDFGIARVVDSTMTVAGTLMATVPYAAPEVLTGERATEAADVYGLGATLHACLTGVAPFAAREDETMVSLVGRVVSQSPPSLVERGVPRSLADVVDRAMSKDPADRQASATELQTELQAAATAPPAAEPTGTMAMPVTDVAAPPVGASPDDGTGGRHRTVVVPAPDPGRGADVGAREPTPDRPVDRAGGNRGLWVAVALVCLAAVGLLGWALTRDDGTDVAGGDGEAPAEDTAPEDTAPEDTAPEDTAPEDTAPEETAPPQTAAPADEAPDEGAPPETEAPPADEPPPAPAGGLAATSTAYLGRLDAGDFDGAWAMASPRFQSTQDRQQWERFWSSYDVEIVGELRVDEDAGTVVVPLTFDGQREDYRMTMVPGDGGTWLIDGPTGS
jgi:hypothetical protein